jgi:Protein of unknown function (DUF1488)
MPQNVTFPKLKPQWVFDRDCVQFFAAIDGEQVLKCLVTAEALEAHFGAVGISMEEAMRAFLEHREEIEAVAREKILKGNYKRGDEVLLRMADFPGKTTTTTSSQRPAHGLRTVIASALSEDPALQRGAEVANRLFEEELATGSIQVTAAWEPVRVPPNKSLAQLTLTDDETGVTVTGLFSAGDLANINYARFSLFRLWDDLLRERGRRQLEALQAGPQSGG